MAAETNQVLHSPLPWKTKADVGHEAVVDDRGKLVADCAIFGPGFTQERNQANAALIIRAINNHSELLAACETLAEADLEAILHYYNDRGDSAPSIIFIARERARAAIAKVRA